MDGISINVESYYWYKEQFMGVICCMRIFVDCAFFMDTFLCAFSFLFILAVAVNVGLCCYPYRQIEKSPLESKFLKNKFIYAYDIIFFGSVFDY